MPPNLPKSDFLGLPNEQGIYYFIDQKKKIVYIGKAKDIKKRVHSHFSGNSNTKTKNYFIKNVFGIDFKLVPNNLLLDLVEATEIKKYWPRYNRSMKRITLNHGLFQYEDRNGYLRFNMGRCGKHDKPLMSFKSQLALKNSLRELVEQYDLCPRLSGLQPIASGKCHYIEDFECQGACEQQESALEYNQRHQKAVLEKVTVKSSYVIKEVEQNKRQQAIVLIENGRYKGYGTVSIKEDLTNIDKIKTKINTAYDDQDMAILVHTYLSKAKEENIVYFN